MNETEKERKELKRPITYWIGEGGGWLLQHVVSGLAATGITPNMFTFLRPGREFLGRSAFCNGSVSRGRCSPCFWRRFSTWRMDRWPAASAG